MIEFLIPSLEQLEFRQSLLNDAETMAFNQKWGGVVGFPRQKWASWYERWILNAEQEKFYRYVFASEQHCFVGEAAWHFSREDGAYLIDILIHSQYRGRGYGGQTLDLLCRRAREQGIAELRDGIALDNPSVHMFLKNGFTELWRDQERIMVSKCFEKSKPIAAQKTGL